MATEPVTSSRDPISLATQYPRDVRIRKTSLPLQR
jgi:hypothetical protein